MQHRTRVLIFEEDREISIRIATLIQEQFDVECVIVQGNEERSLCDNENCVGHMSSLDLFQALLNEGSPCPVSSFNLILRNAHAFDQVSFSQSYRVPPRKFADVRKIPIPAQCKGARKKIWY